MNETWLKINVCRRLGQICLGGAFFSLAISMVLFFKLDIRTAAGYLSGKRAGKEIRRLERESIFPEKEDWPVKTGRREGEEITELLPGKGECGEKKDFTLRKD